VEKDGAKPTHSEGNSKWTIVAMVDGGKAIQRENILMTMIGKGGGGKASNTTNGAVKQSCCIREKCIAVYSYTYTAT
jgi:hypothetical protein